MIKIINTPLVKEFENGKWQEVEENGTHQAIIVEEDGQKRMFVLSIFSFGKEGSVSIETCLEASSKTYFFKENTTLFPIRNTKKVNPLNGLVDQDEELNTIGEHEYYINLMKQQISIFEVQKQFLIRMYGE